MIEKNKKQNQLCITGLFTLRPRGLTSILQSN
jgi:hypothetical protein